MMWYHWFAILVASLLVHIQLFAEVGDGLYHPKFKLVDCLLWFVNINTFWLVWVSVFMLGQSAVLFAWVKAFPT